MIHCGNCGSRDGRTGEWLPCPQCGFDSEFDILSREWVEPHGEPCNQSWYVCRTCGERCDEDELKRVRDKWRCDDCGWVGGISADDAAADAAYDEQMNEAS